MVNDYQTIVATDWLFDRLEAPDLRILDCSWYLPAARRNCHVEYLEEHIPGAQFFNIDKIADLENPLPHMAPHPDLFASRMRSMGIGNGHQVVVYDTAGLLSAARVWWLFRHMGHLDVAVLNGGYRKWKVEGRITDNDLPYLQDRHMIARRQAHMVKTRDDLREASTSGKSQIVDARSEGRFNGTEPEPREGLPSGHIPGSYNLPFDKILNSDWTMKSVGEIRDAFEKAGVDLSKSIITSCGSGVTAAILSLALEIVGHSDHSLYDGSWAEWGQIVGKAQNDN